MTKNRSMVMKYVKAERFDAGPSKYSTLDVKNFFKVLLKFEYFASLMILCVTWWISWRDELSTSTQMTFDQDDSSAVKRRGSDREVAGSQVRFPKLQ